MYTNIAFMKDHDVYYMHYISVCRTVPAHWDPVSWENVQKRRMGQNDIVQEFEIKLRLRLSAECSSSLHIDICGLSVL